MIQPEPVGPPAAVTPVPLLSPTGPPTGPPPPTGVQALIGLNNKDNKDPASSPQKKVATRRASPQIIDSDSEDRDDNNDNNTNIIHLGGYLSIGYRF